MKIERIILDNFRIYQGRNEIVFDEKEDKNIALVAGKNGFGKTTFLTSLIWSFYGSLMTQVEDKYKKDIKNAGGYDVFLQGLLNKQLALDESASKEYSVEIHLLDVLIPSIPCKKVVIKRSFSLKDKKERLDILIDGHENQLTKEVGYQVFINDFILPREIAKFFFFDAEKIVSLAEAKSKEELRSLSKAYSEVLGIKKYEDLKTGLQTLLTKLRRSGVDKLDKERLDELISRENELKELINHGEEQQIALKEDLAKIQNRGEIIQEKLVREGNGITLDQLIEFKAKKAEILKELDVVKNELKKVVDIVPFMIAKNRFKDLITQLKVEQKLKNSSTDSDKINAELKNFTEQLKSKLEELNLINNPVELNRVFDETLKERDVPENSPEGTILLDYSDETARSIYSLFDYVNGAFKEHFTSITKREKNLRLDYSRISKRIKQAEARKDNPLALKLREEKQELEKSRVKLETKYDALIHEMAELRIKFASNAKVLSEYEKNFKLVETDKKKYNVTVQLLSKIDKLITRIKEEKKYALQIAILFGLKKLMHKSDFIKDVRVRIENDIMDIDLLDNDGNVIDKDVLSKGEQQLYATALLKALVDESGINFPVFIDSPLQKFDKDHSQNVIKQFYPAISDQVVLFPLLEKELSLKEFKLLEPNLSSTHLIENRGEGSSFIKCSPSKLFEEFKKQDHVYAH